jgi:hypothetical protein
LGGFMLLVAAYFILSVTIMPQFADLDKVYRLAGYGSDLPGWDSSRLLPTAAVLVAAFLIGWGNTYRKIRIHPALRN